jgi:hypothetical protein
MATMKKKLRDMSLEEAMVFFDYADPRNGFPSKERRASWLFLYFKGTCMYCGQSLDLGERREWVVEHVHEKSRFNDRLDNLTIACNLCNGQKGTKSVEEYRTWLRDRAVALASAAIPLLTRLDHHQPLVSDLTDLIARISKTTVTFPLDAIPHLQLVPPVSVTPAFVNGGLPS